MGGYLCVFLRGELMEEENAWLCEEVGRRMLSPKTHTITHTRAHTRSITCVLQGELMEGENAWLCEEVGRRMAATKRTCIKQLPQTLAIHLKRFEYDHINMERWGVDLGRLDSNSWCGLSKRLDSFESWRRWF